MRMSMKTSEYEQNIKEKKIKHINNLYFHIFMLIQEISHSSHAIDSPWLDVWLDLSHENHKDHPLLDGIHFMN